MTHVGDQLFDHLVGGRDDLARRRTAEHVADCAACRSQLAQTAELLALLPLALPRRAPSAGGRERLLAEARGGRLARFLDRVAGFFDFGIAEAGEVLDAIAERAQWEAPGFPGLRLFHLTAGPRWSGADAGLFAFAPGTRFPEHRHLGDEHSLVLQGTALLDDGRIFRPGDSLTALAGSRHGFCAGDDEDLVIALVIYRGIDVSIFRGPRS